MIDSEKKTCFIISSDNIQNVRIRGYLFNALEPKFKKIFFVGDRKNKNNSSEILWKNAARRNNLLIEIIVFIRLFLIVIKYRPSHIISFSPKVNLYTGLISKLFLIKHIAVISGLGREINKLENSKSIHQIIFRYALKNSTGIVSMNKSNHKFLELLLKPRNILRIPSEAYEYDYQQKIKKNYEKKNFFYISRIVPEKGILLLLETFTEILNKYPDVTLDIAGILALKKNSNEEKKFHKYISIDNIRYHGPVHDNHKNLLFKDSSFFVFPSNYGEGLPMVLLEAQAYECITITSSVPGCLDGVSPSMKKFLCKYDRKSLFKSLELAIETPTEAAKAICLEAKKWVITNHNKRRVLELYLKFFRESGFLD